MGCKVLITKGNKSWMYKCCKNDPIVVFRYKKGSGRPFFITCIHIANLLDIFTFRYHAAVVSEQLEKKWEIKIVLSWSVRNAASAEKLVHRWTGAFVHFIDQFTLYFTVSALINKIYKSHHSALNINIIFNENRFSESQIELEQLFVV